MRSATTMGSPTSATTMGLDGAPRFMGSPSGTRFMGSPTAAHRALPEPVQDGISLPSGGGTVLSRGHPLGVDIEPERDSRDCLNPSHTFQPSPAVGTESTSRGESSQQGCARWPGSTATRGSPQSAHHVPVMGQEWPAESSQRDGAVVAIMLRLPAPAAAGRGRSASHRRGGGRVRRSPRSGGGHARERVRNPSPPSLPPRPCWSGARQWRGWRG